MLTHIRLEGWKSFYNQDFPLGRRVVCVGPNASGKSNFLDALRFLKGWASRLSLDEVLNGRMEGGEQRWAGIRGGPWSGRSDLNDITITTTWDLDGVQVEHLLTWKFTPELHMVRERVKGLGLVEALVVDPPSNNNRGAVELRVGMANEAATPIARRVDDATRSQIADPSKWTRSEVEAVYGAMRAITTLDVQPGLMRDFAPMSARDLGAHGQNLSAVLFRLCQEPEQKEAIVDWLRVLCAPELKDLRFYQDPVRQAVILQLIEDDDQGTYAQSLSDGTLHFLGMLVGILTVPEKSILLLEDLDAGLHPSRLRSLVQAYELSGNDAAQIFATTHSPYVLAALSREGLRDGLIFNRSRLKRGSLVRRLGDLPDFDAVEQRLGIVEMFETEWLEQAL